MINFSIIIPVYNSEQFIGNCLQHIKALNYPKANVEVLIVDGGSSDNTLKIASESGVRVIPCSNINVANSRNIGARASKFDHLVFIDSDCLVNPELLSHAIEHLVNYQIVGSYYKASNKHGWIAKTWLLAENRGSGEVRWLPAGTMIIKKSVFDEIGGFNESYRADEDSELCRRARKRGFHVYNDKSVASIHLGQSDSFPKFFEKEMWHASSNLRFLKDYGIREELFSVFINLFLLVSLLTVFVAIISLGYLMLSLVIAAWIGISLLFAFLKYRRASEFEHDLIALPVISRLFALYIVYLFARGASIFKYHQIQELSH